ncbi:MAG: nuclear transport factor 2 family protein [Deltaproteobacteria bacterium]|nr:nuclear transport factor 2 family protein [Deltaproteobacteria bacterium]
MRFQFEPAPVAGKLSVEETRAAYQRHLLSKGAYKGGDWERMGHIYDENATYHDTFYGWLHGRPAITRWLYESMIGLEEWSYPVQWVAVDEGRVVAHWLNRLPGQRRDGSYFEFPGVSCLTFNDDGQVLRQVDIYDGIETLKVVFEYKLGPLGGLFRAVTDTPGPVMREITRWWLRLFAKKPAIQTGDGSAEDTDAEAS